MSIVKEIKPLVAKALVDLYQTPVDISELTLSITKPEFEGDYTIVLFGLVKKFRTSPDQLGDGLGAKLVEEHPQIFSSFNKIKGFLNLTIADGYWLSYLEGAYLLPAPVLDTTSTRSVIVEYSSPNTNKPLHLGHLRNNFLGWTIAEMLKATGNEVFKTAILNDRGIHICKSMLAWQLFAEGATPESTGLKGDHLVGDYYVMWGTEHKKQMATLIADGMDEKEADKKTPLFTRTQEMLQAWENGDPEVRALWEKMNGWVYEGMNETYRKIGSDFDKSYFESDTYLLGKEFVKQGLDAGVFYQKEDGSVWIDLTPDGLDEKLVMRKDGTSVYITQDIGLADKKYEDFPYQQSIYVIADEQNYHMKVLKLILQKLGKPYADGIFHLSYGMVELPSGRMKTREGTVVDADDIIDELKRVAMAKTDELGKVKDLNTGELNELYDTIALGALKFFLLRVDPKKKMIFNPEESIDFHGFTGPFVQYTYARTRSILRQQQPAPTPLSGMDLLPKEKEMLVLLEQYSQVVEQALLEHNPSLIAIYAFTVAKTGNAFLAEHKVLTAESEEKKNLRLRICTLTANTIAAALQLLGIRVPERM